MSIEGEVEGKILRRLFHSWDHLNMKLPPVKPSKEVTKQRLENQLMGMERFKEQMCEKVRI